MTRTTKTILTIGVVVIISAVIAGAALYFIGDGSVQQGTRRTFLFFPGGGDTGIDGGAGSPAAENNDGSSAVLAEAGLLQIVKEPVIGPALAKDESKILFYKRAGGNLFRAGLDGQGEENVSNLTVVGITDIEWSRDRERTIVSYIEDGALKRFIQTVATATTAFLPQNISAPQFSPDATSRIAYTEVTTSGSRLIIADSRGKNPKTAYFNQIPDFRPSWDEPSTIILATPPTYAVSSLSALVTVGKTSSGFISGAGLGILSDNKGFLYAVSAVSSDTGRILPLRLVNRKGEAVAETSVATLVDKCAWDIAGEWLYCAVPTNAGASLPDNWYKGKVQFSDRLVKIDSRTGNVLGLGVEASFLDAVNLFLDTKNQYLFFVNKADSTLWRLELER